jgi:hypothetical protein
MENPLLQTEFMRSEPSAPPKAPSQQLGSRGSNPLLETEFITGQPSPAGPAPNQSGIVDKALFLTTGREPPPDMSWSEVGSQAIQNAPKSAWEFGKAVVQPFIAPIETATAIGNVGAGLLSKTKGALGVKQDPTEKAKTEASADAIGQFYKERYGSLGGVKRALAEDPVGVMADAATALTGGGALAARLPGMAGRVGSATQAVGTAIDPLSIITKAPAVATKAVTSLTNFPLSLQSGASYKSLQQAVNAGLTANPVFMSHLSGSTPPTDLVKRVNDGIAQVAKQRSAEYMAGMGRIASNQPLPYDKVDEALAAARNVAYHKGSPKNLEAAQVLQEMENTIRKWRANPNMAHNIEDFDALKQTLRSIGYANTNKGTPARKIVDDVANAAKETIPDKRYANIMENYQAATRELTDLSRELTAGNSSSITQIRKILRSQDTKAKGDLIKRLEQIDPELPYAIAGVELHSWMPQGLRGQIAGMLSAGGLGGIPYLAMHPAPIVGLALSSPKLSGLTAYGIGRAGGIAENVRQAAPLAAPALFQSGRAEQVLNQASGGRVERASGGRLNAPSKADMIIAQVDRARKELQRETGGLLNHDDSTIVKALKVANERI